MESSKTHLFNLQRFMILQTKMNKQTSNHIPDEYAFAWYVKLYPFFTESDLHEGYEECFSITKEQVDAVSKYLDDEWLEGRIYSFYDLEGYFNLRIKPKFDLDRGKLIYILKYMKLRGGFDNNFWEKLLEPMKHPSEAKYIASNFGPDDIYLI